MSAFILFPITMIVLACIIITIMESPWLRAVWVLIVVLNTISLARHLPLPGTEASVRDISQMIRECESTIPRNQKCVIDIGLRVDDGTTDTE